MQDFNITAIGGGGFTHATYPELDDFCLSQAGPKRLRIGFIGTASNDDPLKIERFHARFANKAAKLVHLPQTLDAKDLSDHIQDLDMIYVGGGNTQAMVTRWRSTGWDRVLCDAAHRGIAISGVSAGAVCWFDYFLFRPENAPIRPLRGLGLIKGGACPHYSTETDRHAALRDAVVDGSMPETIAIDDGVAVSFRASGPVAICAAEPAASAYRVHRAQDGTIREDPIDLRS